MITNTNTNTNTNANGTITDHDYMSSAREALVARAATERLVDVTYDVTDSPVGQLLVALTPTGVVRIAFENEQHDRVLESLAERISPRILKSATSTNDLRRELDEYFDGKRALFSAAIDWLLVSGFQRAVLDATQRLPYGSTVNYGEIASAAGNPKAVRAAGTALGKNPVPIVIPCHRILRADGSLGGYLGGVEAKKALLDSERAHKSELVTS